MSPHHLKENVRRPLPNIPHGLGLVNLSPSNASPFRRGCRDRHALCILRPGALTARLRIDQRVQHRPGGFGLRLALGRAVGSSDLCDVHAAFLLRTASTSAASFSTNDSCAGCAAVGTGVPGGGGVAVVAGAGEPPGNCGCPPGFGSALPIGGGSGTLVREGPYAGS